MYERKLITDEELSKINQMIEKMERAGEFDNLFKGPCVNNREQSTKEKLLDSISPDMKLYKSTFTKIYGYELTWLGFAEVALTKLENIGCVKAREHYKRSVDEYEEIHEVEMKNTAAWYRKQCEQEFEQRKRRGDELRKKEQEAEQMNKGFMKDQLIFGTMITQMKQDLHQKSDRELLNLLQSMKQENIAL